jgi:hypothetical protein
MISVHVAKEPVTGTQDDRQCTSALTGKAFFVIRKADPEIPR